MNCAQIKQSATSEVGVAAWTGKEIAKRRALLRELLGGQGTSTRPAKRPSNEELALVLEKEFGRSLSVRTVQRMIRDANTLQPAGRQLGRAPGRPRKEQYVPKGAASEQSRSRYQESSARRAAIAAAYYELCVLTGMDAASLHGLLSQSFEGQSWFRRKAVFHAGIAKLGLARVKHARSQSRLDHEISHVLRIHQVSFRDSRGCLLTALLAYDIDTQFVNVAVYEIRGEEQMNRGAEAAPARRGRPPQIPAPLGLAELRTAASSLTVQLSHRLVLALAEDTQFKMALPVGTLILCRSLGDVERLCSELKMTEPDGVFEFEPVTRHAAPAVGGQPWPTLLGPLDWKGLAGLVNHHNSTVAGPRLRALRQELDAMLAKAVRGYQGSRGRPRNAFLRRQLTTPEELDAEKVRRFRATGMTKPHRGSFIAIKPNRITAGFQKNEAP